MYSTQYQRGAALITGLIFMVVLTLLAVAAMRTTSLDEKMAGNALSQAAAFQAAEAALRQGIFAVRSGAVSSVSSFSAGCASGLCLPATGINPPAWVTVFPFGQTAQSPSAVTYSGTQLAGLANQPLPIQPQYILELLPDVPVPSGNSRGIGRSSSGGTSTPFRVTARGWGLAPEAQATTQATYLYF
jgi:type IV pilus assembly protein PilX